MNWKRIIAGGLAAGLVYNLIELGLEPVMGSMMEGFFARLGLPVPGEGAMIGLALSAFVLGIATVWLYAAILPRYGAGVRTALVTAVAVWTLSCLLPHVWLYAFGIFTAQIFWIGTACALVESILATVVGARMYVEAPAHAERLARSPA
jgi:hypothetical protein